MVQLLNAGYSDSVPEKLILKGHEASVASCTKSLMKQNNFKNWRLDWDDTKICTVNGTASSRTERLVLKLRGCKVTDVSISCQHDLSVVDMLSHSVDNSALKGSRFLIQLEQMSPAPRQAEERRPTPADNMAGSTVSRGLLLLFKVKTVKHAELLLHRRGQERLWNLKVVNLPNDNTWL